MHATFDSHYEAHAMNHTTHTTTPRRIAKLSLVALLATLAFGCQANKQHKEWKQQANSRWHNMRSDLMLQMANQQFETGDLDQAQQSVEDALDIDPTNGKLYVMAGRIALERGHLERAYRLFEMAQQNDADLPDAHYYQGLVLQRWQRYDKAQEQYQKAYDIQPDDASYLLAVSEMMVERGQNDEARQVLVEKLDYFDQNSAMRADRLHL